MLPLPLLPERPFLFDGEMRVRTLVVRSARSWLLDRLDAAMKPEDMNLPGYRFHRLKGDRKRAFSVSVSGNWRITFRFEDGDAVDVNLEDYH